MLDDEGNLLGIATRRDLFDPNEPITKRVDELIKRSPAIVCEDSTLREAVDLMAEEGIGRPPVVTRTNPRKVVAILTRSDILVGTTQAPGRMPSCEAKYTEVSFKPIIAS